MIPVIMAYVDFLCLYDEISSFCLMSISFDSVFGDLFSGISSLYFSHSILYSLATWENGWVAYAKYFCLSFAWLAAKSGVSKNIWCRIKAEEENLLCLPWDKEAQRWMHRGAWWRSLCEMDRGSSNVSSGRGLQCLRLVDKVYRMKTLWGANYLLEGYTDIIWKI